MPRGGRRVGAGRKPGTGRAVVIGMDGTRLSMSTDRHTPLDPTTLGGEATLALPPTDIPAAQRQFWLRWAPHALAQRTLILETVPGFRELCEQADLKRQVEKRIRKLGAATEGAEGLMRSYLKLSQRVDATLARFKLTAFGKPADSAAGRKPVANPWAQVAGR